MQCRLRVQGFTLIETLISIFILALAVLGSVGLMLAALRENQRAAQQASATHLAAEFAGMLRAYGSRPAVHDAQVSFDNLDFFFAEPAPELSVSCYTSQCDAAAMGIFLLAEWRREVAQAFPGGRVRVCKDAHPLDAHSGVPSWDCDESAGASVVIKMGWPERSTTSQGPASVTPDIVVFAGPA